jgi:hypothetical protein
MVDPNAPNADPNANWEILSPEDSVSETESPGLSTQEGRILTQCGGHRAAPRMAASLSSVREFKNIRGLVPR